MIFEDFGVFWSLDRLDSVDSVDSLDSVRTDEGRLTGGLEVLGLWDSGFWV